MKTKIFAKAGALLDALCAAPEPMSLKSLAEKLDMPIPTLSRLCNDLIELGWVEKSDYRHFVPGITLTRLGTHAERLSPLISAAGKVIREYSVKSGLNGLLSGYEKNSFFRMYSCCQKFSDHNIFRRSGAFLALLYIAGCSTDAVKDKISELYPDLSWVEKNTLEREFASLQNQKLLLRVGTMRQWYITVPFRRENLSCALTFYGQGDERKQVENVCGEVAMTVARISSAWGRIDDSQERD